VVNTEYEQLTEELIQMKKQYEKKIKEWREMDPNTGLPAKLENNDKSSRD